MWTAPAACCCNPKTIVHVKRQTPGLLGVCFFMRQTRANGRPYYCVTAKQSFWATGKQGSGAKISLPQSMPRFFRRESVDISIVCRCVFYAAACMLPACLGAAFRIHYTLTPAGFSGVQADRSRTAESHAFVGPCRACAFLRITKAAQPMLCRLVGCCKVMRLRCGR